MFWKYSRFWLAAVIVAAPGAMAIYSFSRSQVPTGGSWLLVVAFLIIFLVLTEFVGRSSTNAVRQKYGYLEVLIGADGYASTSKAVVWMWTLVLASALLFLSGMSWFGGLSVSNAFGESWNEYLLLLGGPFAAAVVAKGIVTGRAGSNGAVAATTPAASDGAVGAAPPDPAGEPGLNDLGKSSDGDTSLPDTQYVVFSMVAIIYFVGAFLTNITAYTANPCVTGNSDPKDCVAAIALPDIPSALLGLTSLAALTYVGGKATERQGLRITTITPSPAPPNATISISLVNASATATQATISVTFTTGGVSTTTGPSAEPVRVGAVLTVAVEAPSTAGTYDLVVTTPDGSTTARPIVIAA